MFSANYRGSSKNLIIGIALCGSLALAAIPNLADASINVTDIDLNGNNNAVTVAPGATITVEVTASLGGNGDDNWRGTEYRFGSGAYTCVNTSDDNNGSHTVSFNVTAPPTEGVYDFDVRIRQENNCTGAQDSESLNNGVTVVIPASTTITAVTFNGTNPTTVDASQTVNVSITVNLTGGNDWRATRYEISIPGPNNDVDVCVDTSDATSNGSHTRTFSFNAPNQNGVYNVDVSAYENRFLGFCVGTNDTETVQLTVQQSDVVAPTLSEVTPVPTPDNDATPTYTFSSNEAGAISYGGSCSSGTSAAVAGNNTITFTTLAEGTYTNCTITVTDAATNASTPLAVSAFTIDLTAPIITITGADPMALGTGDSYVEEGATATDNVDASVTVFTAGSVNTLTPGTYSVSYSATDVAGNATTVTREVNVSDDDAPTFSGIPADIVVEAVDALGTLVNYVLPTANDNVDGPVSVVCLPSSGSVFAITTTVVACSAQDAMPNIASASFTITVEDTTDPVVTITANAQTVQAANISGGSATFTVAATDAVDGDISGSVVCDANPGDIFPLDVTTTITCSVTDAHGNTGVATATVTVEDTEKPVITLNNAAHMIADQNDSFKDPGAIAVDTVDGEIPVTAVASGDNTVAGEFTITYTATDSHGNAADPVVRTVTVRPETGGGQSAPGEVLGASTVASASTTPTVTATTTASTTPTVTDSETEGEVLGASCKALTGYIGHGSVVNNPESVLFLQEFLNNELGLTLDVNGTFDASTKDAVTTFQLKYADEILAPWVPFGGSMTEGTGIVYKTTLRMINMISCPGLEIPMPELP